jgi:hypothetical protein
MGEWSWRSYARQLLWPSLGVRGKPGIPMTSASSWTWLAVGKGHANSFTPQICQPMQWAMFVSFFSGQAFDIQAESSLVIKKGFAHIHFKSPSAQPALMVSFQGHVWAQVGNSANKSSSFWVATKAARPAKMIAYFIVRSWSYAVQTFECRSYHSHGSEGHALYPSQRDVV